MRPRLSGSLYLKCAPAARGLRAEDGAVAGRASRHPDWVRFVLLWPRPSRHDRPRRATLRLDRARDGAVRRLGYTPALGRAVVRETRADVLAHRHRIQS